jgi:hypothetical protein
MRRMALRSDIETSLQMLLRPDDFKDYGPNGLQVEGRAEVRHIASGVTASLAFIERPSPPVPTRCSCTTACSGVARTAA